MSTIKNLIQSRVNSNIVNPGSSRVKELLNIPEVNNKEYFLILKDFITSLYDSGVLFRSQDQCIGMSDLISKYLSQFGIKSRLVETRLSVLNKHKDKEFVDVNTVGFLNKNTITPINIDTHVICVTETEIPLLIDLSIGFINKDIPFICKPLIEKESIDNILSSFTIDNTKWTYYTRNDQLIPRLHQISIIDRINKDNKIEKQIKLLTSVIIFIAFISVSNFLRGSYDFYQKYFIKDNNYGPTKVIKE